MMGTEDTLRLTVSALMTRTGERQGDLAAALGQSQAQVSRKQAAKSHWSLEDVDLLAAHYQLHVLDLLAGPTHAVSVLHGAVPSLQAGTPTFPAPPAPRVQTPLTATEPTTTPDPAPPITQAPPQQQPASVPEVVTGPCVLCGQPAQHELDGFPQHLTAEECAAAVAAAGTPQAPARTPVSAPAPAAEEVPAPASPIAEPSVAPVAAADPAVPDTPAAAEPPAPTELAEPLASPAAPPKPPVPAPPTSPAAQEPAPARPLRPAPGYASTTLVEEITDTVHEVLAACSGDVDAARAELVKRAIPDVMKLLKKSRVGGRYEHSEFPPTDEILQKRSQKGADDVWEGRPKWRNRALFAAAKKGELIEVTALDMNAAYLSALKSWLPIGQLLEDTSGAHNPKRAGVHLITPADWDHPDLPNPLGNRMEPGELWVTESTLRLLLDCNRQGLTDAPAIHRSLVSGASEALLEKLRRALAESRKTALAQGDEVTIAYVKAMYSKFVSTIGESSANRELRRPDWMHIIRAKAFANLWMKAHKAHKAGLQVVEISGTDELHVVGDWRPVFPEGRDLNQVKEKTTYILGGKR
ncbi:acyltransferase [Streptomyces tanashiensis]|uniref:acyltransferase n=1 Tax=Streptomyces tanashiensis TaxID=67367 RepID=UPI001676F4AA|nr:acyltransferase [Streptomyces tanashiensis]